MRRASTRRRSAHGSIRWQIQLRGTIKLSFPVAQQLLEQFALKTFPLPDRIIAIPAPERFEGGRTAVGICIIKNRKIPQHDANRPAIDYKVVRSEEKRVAIFGELEKRGVQERRAIQCKGSPCFESD